MKPYNCPCGNTITITRYEWNEDHDEYISGDCDECWGIHVEGDYEDVVIKKWNEKVKELSK